MAPTRARGSAKPPEPPADPVDRLRAICLALPEVTERLSHGEPTWFVRDRKVVVSLDDHHHGADHLAFWCPAGPGVQAELVDQEPVRFFRPPYVGVKGWLGVRIDLEPDWEEINEIVRDAYRLVAPKKLAALLDADGGPARS
ncbi:MAG: MmcQ/YjbR family DNA-binding protein [Acidimicrobiales bacterium]